MRGTSLLCEALARLKQPPRVLLSASAIGYYGNRDPGETIDEGSGAGSGFLADVCTAWEEATRPAEDAGIRVVHMRFGMILAPDGGALGKMLPAFRLGLGGRIGSGKQMMSWIALDDIPRAMLHTVAHPDLAGPVNFVAPKPVSNTLFTKALGEALGRPTVMPLPAFAMKGLFGEMAEELLLGGAKVVPRKLLDAGYRFSYPEIGPALHHLIRQP